MKLEAAFEEYSVLQGHALEENLRISALLSCLSGQLRQYANVMISESSTYGDLRSLVVRWDAAQTKWAPIPSVAAQFGLQEGKNGYVDDGGLAPMEIDRVKGKGKGKGKSKGKDWNDWSQGYKGGKGKDKGKGKSKGKDWNDWSQGYKGGKGQGKSKGKDKGKNKGKGGQKGPCHSCGKMGHLARDCWGQSIQHVSSSDTASTVSGPSVAPSSGMSSSASTAGSSKPRVNRVGASVPMIVELDDSDREIDLTIFALESDCEQHVNMVQLRGASDCVEEQSTCFSVESCTNIPVFDVSADDANDEWTVFQGDSFNLLDPDDWSLEGPRVLAVSSGRGRSTEIVMDSGADASVLPLSCLGVGESVQPESTGFSDAQGHALKAFDWRLCTVELGNVRIRERFLVSNVTCPLLASGKLRKAGWGIVNNGDGPVFVHGDDKYPMLVQTQQFDGKCTDPCGCEM